MTNEKLRKAAERIKGLLRGEIHRFTIPNGSVDPSWTSALAEIRDALLIPADKSEDSYTQKRFNAEFLTEDFEVEITCRKCGSPEIDLHIEAPRDLSDQTTTPGTVEIWCRRCRHTATRYFP